MDSTYSHSDDQMLVIHHECPWCMIMPVKAGAEALDRTDDLAKAWLFSADSGMSVVVSTTADLGYSSFMHQAVVAEDRRAINVHHDPMWVSGFPMKLSASGASSPLRRETFSPMVTWT